MSVGPGIFDTKILAMGLTQLDNPNISNIIA